MVKIVTGKMNSGKTSRIKALYNQNKVGDGIISKKVMIDKDVYGYFAQRLSDNLEFHFMVHEKFFKQNTFSDDSVNETDFCCKIGPYRVYKKAFKRIKHIYKRLIKNKVSPLYFDEVGMLEFEEKGFYKILKKAIKTKDLDLVLSIREDLIDKIVNKLGITEYEIVSR